MVDRRFGIAPADLVELSGSTIPTEKADELDRSITKSIQSGVDALRQRAGRSVTIVEFRTSPAGKLEVKRY